MKGQEETVGGRKEQAGTWTQYREVLSSERGNVTILALFFLFFTPVGITPCLFPNEPSQGIPYSFPKRIALAFYWVYMAFS